MKSHVKGIRIPKSGALESGIRVTVRTRSPSSTNKVESAETGIQAKALNREAKTVLVFPWGVIEISGRLPFTQWVHDLGKR